MTCAVEVRQAVFRCADALEDCGAVVDVDTFPPKRGSRDTWTVEAVVDGPAIPAGVSRELALEGLKHYPQPTSEGFCHVVATA